MHAFGLKTCSTPCDLPQNVFCDIQEWIYWGQDGGLHPMLPVPCVYSGLIWVGFVKGCSRSIMPLGLSAPQDCQRKPPFFSASWKWIWGLSFCRNPGEERHWAGVSSKGSGMLSCCAKGEVKWGFSLQL